VVEDQEGGELSADGVVLCHGTGLSDKSSVSLVSPVVLTNLRHQGLAEFLKKFGRHL
jgi:hypothetical protein